MSGPGNYNQQTIEYFRNNGGKVNRPGPLLLLTTTGAKSGQERTSPVVYSRDGDRLIIIASKGGGPTNPDWYYNLLAHPIVTIELEGERFQARAHVASDDEYERLYAGHVRVMPGFAEYRKTTSRHIPVIILDRIGE